MENSLKTAAKKEYEYMKKLKPIFRYDGKEDFALWQKRAKEKLANLLCMEKIEKCDLDIKVEYEKECDGYKEIRFTFQSERNYRVPSHILIPDSADKNTPLVICLQGHSTGMHISLGNPKFPGDEEDIKGGDRDFAQRTIKEGYCALVIDQRGMGECGGDEKGPKCHIPAMSALINGRTITGERVWDVSRAIDAAIDKFSDYFDGNEIICMGNSGGGTTTIYASCMDERIRLAMPSCAFASYADSIGAMHHCQCNYVPQIAENLDMGDLLCLVAPRFLVVVSGKEDKIFPIESAREMFEITKTGYIASGGKDNCAMIEGNGGHRFYADDAWPVANKYIKQM